jgi:DNA-binding transcriptional MerR regulator
MFQTEKEKRGLLTLIEVAELLGVNYKTLASRVRIGSFPSAKWRLSQGNRRYYRRTDIEQFIEKEVTV